MARIGRVCLALTVYAVIHAATIGAQGPYVGLSIGSSPSSSLFPTGFESGRVANPGVAIGYGFSAHHALEVSGSWLQIESDAFFPCLPPCEGAPTKWDLEAIPLTLGYRYSRPFDAGRVAPYVSISAGAARITESIESDTPPEESTSWLFSGGAQAGVKVTVTGPFALLMFGGYRYLPRTESPGLFKLSGTTFGVGLEIGLKPRGSRR